MSRLSNKAQQILQDYNSTRLNPLMLTDCQEREREREKERYEQSFKAKLMINVTPRFIMYG